MDHTKMKNTHTLSKNHVLLLILILILGALVRLPGVFWGVSFTTKPHFINYHPDEPSRAGMGQDFLMEITNPKGFYPQGFPVQMALASFLVPFREISTPELVVIGRLLSVMYAVLTIGLIYFLSKELFKNRSMALFAGMFLALSGLHVTESHYTTVDISTIFWMYASMYFSLLYGRRDKNIYLGLAIISIGMALAFKLSFLALIPIFYVLSKKKVKLIYWLLTLGGIFIVFMAANGGHYTLTNFILTLENVRNDNVNVIVKHNNWENPLVYLIGLPPAIGLAGFAALLTGIFFLNKKRGWKILNGDSFFIVVLPLVLHGISICFLDIPFSRHFLPLVPFLTMIAAYGLHEIQKYLTSRRFYFLLTFIILYQLLYVAGTEYYYIFDTRKAAIRWVKETIPQGETVSMGGHERFPELAQYKTDKSYDSNYLVLHETQYYRYVRSELCPFKPFPDWEEVYHGNRISFVQIQKIFKGESSFDLIKQFPVRCITPENCLYKKFWGTYPLFIGDTLIYRKRLSDKEAP